MNQWEDRFRNIDQEDVALVLELLLQILKKQRHGRNSPLAGSSPAVLEPRDPRSGGSFQDALDTL